MYEALYTQYFPRVLSIWLLFDSVKLFRPNFKIVPTAVRNGPNF